MNQIKLVIWDLDDTFWQGTLSESPITYLEKNHSIVVELTRRGIVNSIVSKNNHNEAKQVLENHGIWHYFVFPKIDWQHKGHLIKTIIEEMRLRPANVLFIDDNRFNREEAIFYSPGIQAASPKILETLLNQNECRGKDDKSLSRLTHYKLLEKKNFDQKISQCSNEDFLRKSNICVEIVQTCLPETERILELINRTNQLNYTKLRVTYNELLELFNNPDIQKGYIKAADNYGDYGICGFYALKENRLIHFLFSCRVLNMEIENWLYHKLGYPQIEIIGEVAAPLSKKKFPDWIHETSLFPKNSVKNCSPADGDDIKIIVKGGCDLLQIQNYLLRGSLFDSEVSYVSENGYRINCSHIEILKQCNQSTIERYGPIIDRIHFFDRNAFRSKFLSNDHNVYIYSALDNYVRGLYRYRNTDFIIPFGNFNSDLTDESTWAYHSRRSEKHYLDIDFLKWFKGNFTFLGPMDPDAFKLSIAWLCGSISPDKLLIILNGSEVEYIKNDENKRWEHHRKMNQALHNVVNRLPHVAVCDVRKFVKNSSDHSHNIRHYTRRVYFQIAQYINETIQEKCDAQSDFCLRHLNLMKYFLKITGQSSKKRFYKKHILQRTKAAEKA